MSKTYTRLTEDERYQIYEGVAEKRSHREIATLPYAMDKSSLNISHYPITSRLHLLC